MINKMKFNRITSLVLALLLFVMMLIPMFMVYPKAAERQYSSVLDDLKKDASFDETLYPRYSNSKFNKLNSDDNQDNNLELLNVIGVSESENDELFIYVYLPSSYSFTIKSVSLYYGFSNKALKETSFYELELVSHTGKANQIGPLAKFLVKDFVVPDDEERYYNIISITRSFVSGYDSKQDGILNIDPSVPVGQQWCVYYEKNSIHYEMNTFNTVQITPVFCGDIVVSDGLTLGSFAMQSSAQSCWFYCFDIQDYDVERISEVTFNYSQVGVLTYSGFSSFDPDDEVDNTRKENIEVSLFDKKIHTISGKGLFSKSFTYSDIQKTDVFITSVEEHNDQFSPDVKSKIEKSQFTLVFAVTERIKTNTGTLNGVLYSFYNIYHCSPLTITFFDISGDVYNMGVVSDVIDPDNISDAVIDPYDFEDLKKSFNDWKDQIEEFLEKAVIVVGLVALLCGLSFISPLMTVVKFIWNIIVHIFLLIWSILTLPFKILFRQRE